MVTTAGAPQLRVVTTLSTDPGLARALWHWRCSISDMSGGQMKVAEWLQIIRGEYLEIPDLALTRAEMRRMWTLDEMTCDTLVDALVQVRFLRLTHRNRYVRGSGVT
jgi:hypothetical protein